MKAASSARSAPGRRWRRSSRPRTTTRARFDKVLQMPSPRWNTCEAAVKVLNVCALFANDLERRRWSFFCKSLFAIFFGSQALRTDCKIYINFGFFQKETKTKRWAILL
jgi:hypothetical protein